MDFVLWPAGDAFDGCWLDGGGARKRDFNAIVDAVDDVIGNGLAF